MGAPAWSASRPLTGVSTLVRNAASSALERLVSAALTLVIVPVQVRLLGVDAYGLLGFIASLQVAFNTLDLGLGPTITREIAAATEGDRAHSRALIRTFAALYWSLAIVAAIALVSAAPWLAGRWLHAEALPRGTVTLAIRIVAFSILLRWPAALYAGAIAGAQRLDVVNAIRIGVSVVKLLGGLLVLVWSRSLVAYLVWLAVAALIEILCYMAASGRFVPAMSFGLGFSRGALRRVWRFSLHMNLISILVLVIGQIDRLTISRLLPIAALGVYAVAYNPVLILWVIQSIVTTALFPSLAQQINRRNPDAVLQQCAIATQLLMYLVCGLGAGFVFFGRDLLALWISDAMAARAAAPLAILTIGALENAMLAVPYTLSIAAGRTSAPLALYLVTAPCYVLVSLWCVHGWGIQGAAWAWAALNLWYLVVLPPLIRRQIPIEPFVPWMARQVLPFAATAFVIIGAAQIGARHFTAGRWAPLWWLAGGGLVYAGCASAFLDRRVWRQLQAWRRGDPAFQDAPPG
jgi:O-antigen/teichoic acid export membrane protein